MKKVPMLKIRRAYEEANLGGNWFDKDAMRFFRTVLPQYGWEAWGSYWFVTAETNPSGTKAYSVRRMKGGDVDTIGDFHSHKTSHEATKAMKLAIIEEAEAGAGS